MNLQILDVVDCTGSGDVDMSKVVKADDEGGVVGVLGDKLRVNPAWNNPSGIRCILQAQTEPRSCFKQVTHRISLLFVRQIVIIRHRDAYCALFL